MAVPARLCVVQALLPSARGSDGGGVPRSAVCRRQPVRSGRGPSNTRPYNYQTRKQGRLWIRTKHRWSWDVG